MHVTGKVIEGVGEGRSVLCHGPPLAGKRELLVGLVREAAAAGHHALFVTTDESATGLLSRYPDSFPADRVGIVDCTDAPVPGTAHTVQRVGSAADLTGIAVGVSKAVDELGDGTPGVVAVDSVTTLTLYSEFDRVYRFVHSFVQRVRDQGGVLALGLDDDSLARQEWSQLRSVADHRVEFRDATECRLVDRDGSAGEWEPMASTETVRVETTEDASTAASPDPDDDPRPGSLAALISTVRTDRPTLTLGNVPTDVDLDPLLDRVGRLGIPVERTSFADGEPEGVAMLHDGETLLAAGALADALRSLADPFGEEAGDGSAVLAALPEDVFVADGADRNRLLRASRTVERLALRRNAGTVHAGFQLFSRLTRDEDTLAVYERLVETGVTVHLYGELDASLPDPLDEAVVHGLPAEEVSESWFVVFGGDGTHGEGGVLVTRERAPGRYDGFWSYDAAIVGRALDYLESEYEAVEP